MERETIDEDRNKIRKLVVRHSELLYKRPAVEGELIELRDILEQLKELIITYKGYEFANFTKPTGLNVLHLAIAKKNYVVIPLLFNLLPTDIIKELVNAVDNIGRTPLHLAAAFGITNFKTSLETGNATMEDFDLFEHLIKNGADLNSMTIGKETPLMKAAQFGRKDAFERLRGLGAIVDCTNVLGQTADNIWDMNGYPPRDDKTKIAEGIEAMKT